MLRATPFRPERKYGIDACRRGSAQQGIVTTQHDILTHKPDGILLLEKGRGSASDHLHRPTLKGMTLSISGLSETTKHGCCLTEQIAS